MQRPRQILIFGGAFNPPTLAHEAAIAACLDLPQFDEVWIMPSGDRDDKHIGTADSHRLAMLALIVAERFNNNPRLQLTDFELRLARPNATYRTLNALRQTHPGTTFWFAFGTDSYRTMPTWPNGTQLQKDLQHIVLFAREGQVANVTHALTCTIAPQLSGLSSTAARKMHASGKPLNGVVSPAIEHYIRRHRLYE